MKLDVSFQNTSGDVLCELDVTGENSHTSYINQLRTTRRRTFSTTSVELIQRAFSHRQLLRNRMVGFRGFIIAILYQIVPN